MLGLVWFGLFHSPRGQQNPLGHAGVLCNFIVVNTNLQATFLLHAFDVHASCALTKQYDSHTHDAVLDCAPLMGLTQV